MNHLESDLLRTFLAVAEAGSVSGGGKRINRSQSATSLQVQRLESIVGRPLFERHGRGMVLTVAGEQLRPIAERVTQSLDHVLADLRGTRLEGRLRIGLPDDQQQGAVTAIVGQFATRHPDVSLEVQSALGSGFAAAIGDGRLDMAVFEVPEPLSGDEVLRQRHLVWARSQNLAIGTDNALPIAVFDRDCWWRDAALSILDKGAIRYRIVFTSESTHGVRSAVEAGIAAGMLDADTLGKSQVPVEHLDGYQNSYLVLRRGRAAIGPVCDAMSDAIRLAFH
jgi:DNA-binding transcriptional LysR family regulator